MQYKKINLSRRQLAIINVLSATDNLLPEALLAQYMDISLRTVRSEIDTLKNYNPIFSVNGFEIVSRHGIGYGIEVKNQELFLQYIEMLRSNDYNEHSIETLSYSVLGILLKQSGYIHLYELENVLLRNRNPIMMAVAHLRERLAYYNLGLVTSKNNGYKLAGTEFYRRLAIIDLLNFDHSLFNQHFKMYKADKDVLLKIVESTIFSLLSFDKIQISYENIIKICHFLYVSKIRNDHHFCLLEYKQEIGSKAARSSFFKHCTQQIINQVAADCSLQLTNPKSLHIWVIPLFFIL